MKSSYLKKLKKVKNKKKQCRRAKNHSGDVPNDKHQKMSRKKTKWRRRSSPKVSLVYRVWRAGDSLEKPDMSVESAESVHQDGLIWQLTSSRTSLGRLETEQVLTAEGGELHHHRPCLFFLFFLPTFGLVDFNQPEGFASTCSSGGLALDKLELLFLNTSYGLFTRGIRERKN